MKNKKAMAVIASATIAATISITGCSDTQTNSVEQEIEIEYEPSNEEMTTEYGAYMLNENTNVTEELRETDKELSEEELNNEDNLNENIEEIVTYEPSNEYTIKAYGIKEEDYYKDANLFEKIMYTISDKITDVHDKATSIIDKIVG